MIGFTIGPSGQVLTREVKKSSGSKVLDDAAMAALDHAAPFPPMPQTWPTDRWSYRFHSNS